MEYVTQTLQFVVLHRNYLIEEWDCHDYLSIRNNLYLAEAISRLAPLSACACT